MLFQEDEHSQRKKTEHLIKSEPTASSRCEHLLRTRNSPPLSRSARSEQPLHAALADLVLASQILDDAPIEEMVDQHIDVHAVCDAWSTSLVERVVAGRWRP